MAISDRLQRERAERRLLIISTARILAEAEGWDAVTTRRLSSEIEYSQPVLYKHFAGMEAIVEAVAIEGFGELAELLHHVRVNAPAERSLAPMAQAYLEFARTNPALYDAMFSRATTLRFAADDAAPQMTAGFTELREAVMVVAHDRDVDTLTEVFWAALHGLATLIRGKRLRSEFGAERVEALAAQFVSPKIAATVEAQPAAELQ